MKYKRKPCPLVLTSILFALFLIFTSSTAFAANAQNASPTINETRITTNGSAYSPAIYGNGIVWEDYRNGDWSRDIYTYNTSTSKETRITTSGSAESPAIYGNRIVWEDSQNGSSNIYVYDLSTSKKTQITTTGAAINPVIYGDRVLWMDDHLGVNYDIYIYDLSTSKKTQITTSGSAYSPAIYKDRIIWYADRNGSSDVYMYNISTSKNTQITTSGSATCPAIYDDKIVWQDDRNGSSNIYMYNFSTSKETKIITTGSAYSPAIYGDRIVWEDYRNGSYINESGDIYMYDLSTSKETKITNTGSAGCPAIYNDRIVWQDCRNKNSWDNSDIYMCTVSGNEPGPILPVANFSSNITSGKAPLNVAFTDKSTGSPNKWRWNFGDGTNSTAKNPVHRYSKAGNYTVALTASNAAGNNTTIKTNYVKVTAATRKPIAAFSGSPTSGNAPLNVSFTDKSTGTPTKWKWTFGDGINSTVKNPIHKYSKAGNYTVALTVSNAAGSNTTTKKNYIKVTTVTKLVSNFTSNVTSGKAPLTVGFTDKSTGIPTAWKWSFGDRTNSTVKNPAHKYSKTGNYTVSLTVKNAAGTNTKTITNYITVKKAPVKPVAAFSGTPTSGKAPLKVTFTDKSTNSPTSWKWDFGDGASSTAKSPAHKYSKAGKYTVKLTVKNAAGSSTITKTSYIKVT